MYTLRVGNLIVISKLDASLGNEQLLEDKLKLGVRPGDSGTIKEVRYDNHAKVYKVTLTTGGAKGKVVQFRSEELKRHKTEKQKVKDKVKERDEALKYEIGDIKFYLKEATKLLNSLERKVNPKKRKKKDKVKNFAY